MKAEEYLAKDLIERVELAENLLAAIGFPSYGLDNQGWKLRQGQYLRRVEKIDIYKKYAECWAMNPQDSEALIPKEALFDTLYEGHKAASETGFKPINSLKEFILHFMKKKEYFFGKDGHLKHVNLEGVEESLRDDVFITAASMECNDIYNRSIPKGEDGKSLLVKPLSVQLMPKAFDCMRMELALKGREMLHKSLRFTGKNDERLNELIQVIADTFRYEHEADIIMLKQFFWTLKRRIFSKPVETPIFFSFTGVSGIGKSRFIKDIIPTGAMYDFCKLDMINNELLLMAMVDRDILINFDELVTEHTMEETKAWQQIANLKRVITQDIFTTRRHNSHDTISVHNMVVWCSTSNIPIYDLVCDATGMRRFYSMESKLTRWNVKEGIDYTKLNELIENISELYQLIDEGDDKGFLHISLPGFDMITEIQGKYAKENQITRWMLSRSEDMILTEEGCDDAIESYDFIKQFNNWRKVNGDKKPYANQSVEHMITETFGIKPKYNRGKKKYYYFVVKTEDAETPINGVSQKLKKGIGV